MYEQTTITYQMSGTLTKSFNGSYTVGELLADRGILSVLGAPEGIVATASGETLSSSDIVSDFAMIVLEKRASSKA